MMNWAAEGTSFCPLIGLIFSDTFSGVHLWFGEGTTQKFLGFLLLFLEP